MTKKPKISIAKLNQLEAEKDRLRSRDRQLAHGLAHLMMSHETKANDLRIFFEEWIVTREAANKASDNYWATNPFSIRRRRKPAKRKRKTS